MVDITIELAAVVCDVNIELQALYIVVAFTDGLTKP